MRTSMHSGRIGNAKHNDRQFDLEKAKHIKQEMTRFNQYSACYEGMTFEEAELKFYEENFKELIADKNARALSARRKDQMTSPEKLLKAPKTMPEQIIYQIGNVDKHTTSEQLKLVYNEFRAWHQSKFGEHVKILNEALHVDEATPHIQVRQVWVYEDAEKRYLAIGQHKALEALGYELPIGVKRDRRNNLKVYYTQECREKWLSICKEHNIEVETEPEHRAPNEQNLEKLEYLVWKQEDTLERQREYLSRAIKRAVKAADSEVEAMKRMKELNALVKGLKGQYNELVKIKEKEADKGLLGRSKDTKTMPYTEYRSLVARANACENIAEERAKVEETKKEIEAERERLEVEQRELRMQTIAKTREKDKMLVNSENEITLLRKTMGDIVYEDGSTALMRYDNKKKLEQERQERREQSQKREQESQQKGRQIEIKNFYRNRDDMER